MGARTWLLPGLMAVGLPVISNAHTDAAAVRQAIEACRHASTTTVKTCPDLVRALSDSDLGEQLGEGWQTRLRIERLADLEELMERYCVEPSERAPDPRRLAPIEKELRTGPQRKPSWWQRLMEWLRRLQAAPQAAKPEWLGKLLSLLADMPRWIKQTILDGSLVIIVTMAAALIWREGRIVWAQWRRAHPRRAPATAGAPVSAAPLTWDDVERVPPAERSVWLLRLLVQTLVARSMLGSERCLTHGELIEQAALDDASARQRFARIARLAEQRRYASASQFHLEHGGDEMENVLLDGRQLYRQLVAGSGSAK